jgi:ribose transport system ATP-binding protein
MNEFILNLTGITKHYPGVVALNGVNFSIRRGEVVGLIGENGAGKSTLMRILGGVAAPSAGTIFIEGEPHAALTVAAATRAGIAFVHQELNVFENLDVAANVFLGREPTYGGVFRLIHRRRLHAMVTPLLERLGTDFAADTPVAALSIAQRQMVEIAKALSVDARIIIMDEPTSSLTLSETERLLRIVDELRAAGVSVIFITHRLGEVKSCADRVVCLRDGCVVGELAQTEIDHANMIRLMIGRDLKSLYIPPKQPSQEAGCVVTDLVTSAFPNRSVSLTVGRGEILGLAGLVGAGRTSFARAMFGVDRILSGEIRLNGDVIHVRSPRQAIAYGIYLVPEDRKREGLITDMTITENVSLASLRRFTSMLLIRHGAEEATARAQQVSLAIKTPSCNVQAVNLSGGNQQKVVLAKWLSMSPRLIIFDEPTRGIDVGAKGEIYALMRNLADSGVAILMISSDMEEVIGVSDRIAVMHDGAVAGQLERPQFSELNVLRLAIGDTARRMEAA